MTNMEEMILNTLENNNIRLKDVQEKLSTARKIPTTERRGQAAVPKGLL